MSHHPFYQHNASIEKPRQEHIHGRKIAHMVGVAEYMRDRAEDYGLDGNVAYTIGLLHDIGYLEGRVGHEPIGAEILEACGMQGKGVEAIARHAKNLGKLPPEEITPLLVLLVEADLSVDMNGFRVGFDARLKDIGSRYGTENNPHYDDVVENVAFIQAFQKEKGIPNQTATLKKVPSDDFNHGSGKWVGAETKAKILAKKSGHHPNQQQ